MANLIERGWGDPRKPDYQKKFIVKVTVGPFPAGGALAKAHPKVTVNVHKDIALIFQCFLTDLIKNHGYRLDKVADDWGFCVRPVRGYEKKYAKTHNIDYLSNHSGGTALDVNSATNPMTKDGVLHTDMPKDVVKIAGYWRLTWGGSYKGARKDPMHFEWIGTNADAKAFTKQLQAQFKKAA